MATHEQDSEIEDITKEGLGEVAPSKEVSPKGNCQIGLDEVYAGHERWPNISCYIKGDPKCEDCNYRGI